MGGLWEWPGQNPRWRRIFAITAGCSIRKEIGRVGGGRGLEFDRWLKPGDLVKVEIEGTGILRSRVLC